MKLLFTTLVALAVLAGCSSEPKKVTMADIPQLKIAVQEVPGARLQQLGDLVVVVPSPSETLLEGQAQFALTTQKWDDTTMGKFLTRYGKRPVMTVLTAVVESDEDRDAFTSGEKTIDEPWLLYSNLSLSEEQQQNIKQVAAWLYSEDGQDKLAESGLLKLPEPMRDRGLVGFGLQDAKYTGGYK